MRFIIPAKTNSTRIENKNWREFSGGKSLVQICVEKLLPFGEVWVSCELIEKRSLVESWGAQFHWRSEAMTCNNCSFRDWMCGTRRDILFQSGVCADEDTEAFGWAQVTSPLFNDYGDMLARWASSTQYENFDSMVAVYPKKEYLLDSMFRPVGWNWGPWHTTGQNLPTMYQMPWVFSILTPESLKETGYHIGARPHWYVSSSPQVDIDTWTDWTFAKFLYESPEFREPPFPLVR